MYGSQSLSPTLEMELYASLDSPKTAILRFYFMCVCVYACVCVYVYVSTGTLVTLQKCRGWRAAFWNQFLPPPC